MHAQEKRTEISVSPAVVDIATKPNKSVIRNINVKNTGDIAVPISFELKPLVDDRDFTDIKNSLSDATKWISLDETAQLFLAGSIKKIPLKVDIPKNAAPGGHYAQISIRALSLESTNEQNQKSIVIPEITVDIFITVSGDIVESFEIEKGNLFPPFTSTTSNQTLNFKVRNNGNVHGLVTPFLVLKKGSEEIDRKQLDSKIILPNSDKEFSQEWTAPDRHGFYTAHIEFSYGSSSIYESSKRESIVVTYSLLKLFTLAIVTFISIYLFKNRKNLKKAYYVLVNGQKQ